MATNRSVGYPELQALFDHADISGLASILITDTLGAKFQSRTDAVLQIPRGRIDAFSTHATTLAFLEILLIGIAAQRPTETITNLTKLNQLRKGVTGTPLDL